MNDSNYYVSSRMERVKRGLMIGCALILFALGVWLLLEPAQARGAEKVDNVVAAVPSWAGVPVLVIRS